MGGGQSTEKEFDKADLEKAEELKMISNFTDREIIKLIRIFNEIDADNSGTIDREELFRMPQFQANPFLDRIMTISDEGNEGLLDLKEFAKLMSVFSIRATREQKLRYAFKVYDVDGDDKISREDLQFTLTTLTNGKLEGEFMEEVLDQVFLEADNDNDGFIMFDDFSKVVLNTDIEGKLTMDF